MYRQSSVAHKHFASHLMSRIVFLHFPDTISHIYAKNPRAIPNPNSRIDSAANNIPVPYSKAENSFRVTK